MALPTVPESDRSTRGTRGRIKQLSALITVLTLPRIESGGFFLHPARLLLARLGREVEAVCPEAFSADAEVAVCPTVPAKALCKILRAAFWSRSSTRPQLGQMCVRTLKLF